MNNETLSESLAGSYGEIDKRNSRTERENAVSYGTDQLYGD